MANDRPSPMFPSPQGQQPELLLSAVLHLMSHYHAGSPCEKLAGVIERHLQVLSARPAWVPCCKRRASNCRSNGPPWWRCTGLRRRRPPCWIAWYAC